MDFIHSIKTSVINNRDLSFLKKNIDLLKDFDGKYVHDLVDSNYCTCSYKKFLFNYELYFTNYKSGRFL